jgi:hypothetical protein
MNTIDRLKFIKAAVAAPRERRPTIEKPYYDATTGKIIATDGRAMHWWSLTAKEKKELGIAKGQESSWIDIVISGKTFSVEAAIVQDTGPGWKFPNYERIIPEYSTSTLVDYKLSVSRYKTMEMARMLVKIVMPIDIKYLEPFWALKYSEWSVIKSPSPDWQRSPLAFRGEGESVGMWGVVMPFNLE